MRRIYLFFVLVLAGAALVLSGCDSPFGGGTSISGSDQEDVQEAASDAAKQTIDDTPTVTVGTIDASSDGQTVTFEFAGTEIDESTLSNAITFRVLTDGTEQGGTFERNAELTPDKTDYLYLGGGTAVTYTFDLANDTDVSDPIEVEVDASKLTAGGGLWQLDTDGDGVSGESPEDNLIAYIGDGGVAGRSTPPFYGTVNNANVTGDTNALARDPRATLDTLGLNMNTAAVGDTSIGLAYTENNVEEADLNTAVELLKYNASSHEWEMVSFSGSLDTGTNTYRLGSIPEISDGDVYKVHLNNPYELQETSTTNGYKRRATTDQNKSVRVSVAAFERLDGNASVISGGNSSYILTGSIGGPILDGANFFHSEREVAIAFDATKIGQEGLDQGTISTDSLRLYDVTEKEHISWSSVQVVNVNATNDVVVLTIPQSAADRLDGYGGGTNDIELHVGPTVKSLGDAANDDSDDLFLGDLLNTGYQQFRVETAIQL